MSPFIRKSALIAHIVSSAGWIGAVALYLALAITGLTSLDARTVVAAYLAMQLAVRLAIIPLSFASLLSGLVMSLGTPWGLFRHYWVLFKLFLNLFAITILLLYTQSIDFFAKIASAEPLSSDGLRALRNPTHVVHTIGAMLVLLTATTLSVYKPRGMTRYGFRKQREELNHRDSATRAETRAQADV